MMVCAGLALGQPAVAASPTVGGRVAVAQLDPFQALVCGVVESLHVSFAGFPGVSGLFASLQQSFGCPGAPPPGTTTTTVVATTTTFPPTTSTLAPSTSTTGVGPTSSTTSTTLLPCMPTTSSSTIFPPTTVPCIPTSS
ncbi:MAG: hypothetical protein ACR2KK_21770 [Acidimicrobiales bacterium]